jgi:hypothetical protein
MGCNFKATCDDGPFEFEGPTIRLFGTIREKNLKFLARKRAPPQTVGYILAGPSTEIIRLLVALTATSVTRSPGQGRQRYRHDEREHQGTIDRYRASNNKHD